MKLLAFLAGVSLASAAPPVFEVKPRAINLFTAPLSARAQKALGLPEGLKTYSPYPFGGMNQLASAISIADTEFLWLENFVRVGDGNLRTGRRCACRDVQT